MLVSERIEKNQSRCMSAHTWPLKPDLILILPLWRHFSYLTIVVGAHDWCSHIIPHVCIHNMCQTSEYQWLYKAPCLKLKILNGFKDKNDVFNLIIKWGRGLLIIVEIYISLFRHCVFADTHIFSTICVTFAGDIRANSSLIQLFISWGTALLIK